MLSHVGFKLEMSTPPCKFTKEKATMQNKEVNGEKHSVNLKEINLKEIGLVQNICTYKVYRFM